MNIQLKKFLMLLLDAAHCLCQRQLENHAWRTWHEMMKRVQHLWLESDEENHGENDINFSKKNWEWSRELYWMSQFDIELHNKHPSNLKKTHSGPDIWQLGSSWLTDSTRHFLPWRWDSSSGHQTFWLDELQQLHHLWNKTSFISKPLSCHSIT